MNKSIVVDSQAWLAARLKLLDKEKELTRLRDEVSGERRKMPWVAINKPYQFVDNDGNYDLSELFGEHSQLIVYHFMYGPAWEEPCKSCSFWSDNFNGIDIHLAHRDISFLAVSTASINKLETFKERMGWSFRWLSCGESDFNHDFYASFTDEQKSKGDVFYNYQNQPWFIDEMAAVSVFVKDESGQVFHTYSSYSRGLDILNGAYNYIDLTPKGRDEEDGIMHWLRIRDQYD